MCGRYVSPDEGDIERHWLIDRRNSTRRIIASFNVAPTTQVPLLRQTREGLELTTARWGLIPSWWNQDRKPPHLTFNARSEEAFDKPTWRPSLRGQRGIMPALGWYEWNENETVERPGKGRSSFQPYYFSGDDVLAIAALCASWDGPDGTVLSCALLSREATGPLASIHHRMPVLLAPEDQAAWLEPSSLEPTVRGILAANSDGLGCTAHPVNPRVGNVRNQDAGLIEAFERPRGLFDE